MAAEEIWFVNKTSTAVDGLHLAKPNSQIWGPNYLEGGGVPEGGRTVLAGVKAGDYDVKLHMKTGGNCIIHKVAIKPGDSFQVSDSDLKECTK
ncbi:MAG: hypothetical protein JOY71_07725 [Acetobacteraceae bacterium]|nr:hypothetical protein [Acetobacteraceae bacterium]MBV8522000.1 hypothetical protein [Acetobacteraceae bacterium]MBV8592498.1 hypothetical protein [Acetobacteraceae bacterium]